MSIKAGKSFPPLPYFLKNLDQLGEEIHERVGEDKVLVLPVGGSAIRYSSSYLEKALYSKDVPFEVLPLEQDALSRNVREIKEINPTGCHHGLYFDDTLKTGESMAKAMEYILPRCPVWGLADVYVAVIEDRVGGSNITALPTYKQNKIKYRGPKKLLEEDYKGIFNKLKEENLISYISDYVSPVHHIQYPYEFTLLRPSFEIVKALKRGRPRGIHAMIKEFRHLHDILTLHEEIRIKSLMKEGMTYEDMEEVADEIAYSTGGKKTLVCLGDYTSKIFFSEIFEPVLRKYHPDFEVRLLEHEDNLEGEVRRIDLKRSPPLKKIKVPGAEYLLTVVYSSEDGRTNLGILDWALDNAEALGIRKCGVYSLVAVAYQPGGFHFPIAKAYPPEKFMTPWEYMELFAPQTYKKHFLNDTIRYMGLKIPQRNYAPKEEPKIEFSEFRLFRELYKVSFQRYPLKVSV